MSLMLVGLFTVSVSSAQESRLPHRLLVSAIYRLYTVNESRNVEWVYEHETEKNPVILDAWALSSGNFLFSHRYGVIELNAAKEKVWEYDLRSPTAEVEREKLTELHSCQPLADGKFLILECSENRLFEIDRAGNIHREIALTGKKKGPHSRYGVARKRSGLETHPFRHRKNAASDDARREPDLSHYPG